MTPLLLAAALAAGPVERLNDRLLHGDSATAVLQTLCDVPIQVRRLDNRPEPRPPAWVRASLKPGRGEPVHYRRVELVCGAEVLSRADNWYLPARLTPGMNGELLTTQTPFGRAVGGMGFKRRTLRIERPGQPLAVLRHRTVLVGADRRPFSVVQEAYSAADAR
ncbi:hypothetical protein [Phenylobacterium sp.]|jgi:chorismate-pyruvate lyase|uniref:hypothetical protein n=1 Tax=Phenylobacterium sp. TaxID=1871053 RepID=UPI002F951779